MNSCVFGQVFPLSKSFVTNIANEGLVDAAGRGFHCSSRNLILYDSCSLAQGVSLSFRLDACLADRLRCARHHLHVLHRDPVALGIPLPHGVGVVHEQVAVGQGSGHAHQLQGVSIQLEAGGSTRGDG